jgi:hypothetical protein
MYYGCMRKSLSWWHHWFLPHKSNQFRPLLIQSRGFLLVTVLAGVWSLGLFAALHLPQLHHILGYGLEVTVPDILGNVNAEREKAGLPPLKLNPELANAAQAKAADMFQNQYWAHNSPDGTQPWYFIDQANYSYQTAGENLARNFTQADTMVQAWLNSPTHRANILDSKYTDTGIAVLQGELDGVTTTIVVQMFGQPSSAIAAAPPPALPQQAAELAAQPTVEPGMADLVGVTGTPEPNPILGEQFTSLTTQTPLLSPLTAYRAGIMLFLGLVMAVLVHDHYLAQRHGLKRSVGRNWAHLIIVAAVIIALAFAKTGQLL